MANGADPQVALLGADDAVRPEVEPEILAKQRLDEGTSPAGMLLKFLMLYRLKIPTAQRGLHFPQVRFAESKLACARPVVFFHGLSGLAMP